jgi:hypothetical protein
MHDTPYREAVCVLNWEALATRPDIAYTVPTVMRFSSDPGPAHWGSSASCPGHETCEEPQPHRLR